MKSILQGFVAFLILFAIALLSWYFLTKVVLFAIHH